MRPLPQTTRNSDYTWRTFVAGGQNRGARAAARAAGSGRMWRRRRRWAGGRDDDACALQPRGEVASRLFL